MNSVLRIGLFASLLFFSSLSFAQFSVVESFNDSGYTFSFFSLASTETDQTEIESSENGTGRLSFYNYLTVASRLNYDLKGGIRLPFQYITAGRDRFNDGQVQRSEVFLQDIILFVNNSSLALLPLDVGVYWEGRIYLPTGKNSQRQDRIGALRNHFIFSKVLSREFDWEYDQKISYFHQARTAYSNTFTDKAGRFTEVTSLTKAWELEHRMNFWYKIDAENGLGVQVTHEDTYYNSSRENSYNVITKDEKRTKGPIHLVKLGPSARFALNSKINFILTFQDVVDSDTNMSELGQFKSENTEVALLSFVRF